MAVSFKTAGSAPRCDGAMKSPNIGQAVQFLAANARVIDLRRYERLFEGGEAQPVRDAVAAYRNPDGGFGHALEPDGRAPVSQAAAVELALHIMDETGVWDTELVTGACSAGWPPPPRPKAASCSCKERRWQMAARAVAGPRPGACRAGGEGPAGRAAFASPGYPGPA